MTSILAAGILLKDSRKGALLFDETGKVFRLIETSFEPHSFYQNPQKKNEVYTFVKEGFQSAKLDISADQPPVYFHATEDCFFYGHAQFSPDGSIFYATERKGSGKGRIVVRDSATLEVKNIFSLPGFGPHDMVLCDLGKVIAVVIDNFVHTVGKMSPSEVLFLDSDSGKVLEKSTLDHKDLCLGHLDISKNGTIFGLMHDPDKKMNRPFASGERGQTLFTEDGDAQIEHKLIGQALSLLIDEDRGQVVITYPEDNLVMVWDLFTKKLKAKMIIPRATGVCFSQDRCSYLVTTSLSSLFKIDVNDFKLISEFKWEESYHFFAHLYALNLIKL